MKELTFSEYLVDMAEEAKTNPRPWEAFEIYSGTPGRMAWQDNSRGLYPNYKYRRKPRTVTRTITLPVGLSEAKFKKMYRPDFAGSGSRAYSVDFCRELPMHQDLLRAGLLYATEAEAIAATNAILGMGDE